MNRLGPDGSESPLIGGKRALLAWYGRRQRPLPWRRCVTPYKTWVSEVMLQQTTVKIVVPRYQAFLRRFPDVGSLASASEAEVLRAWAGLGYYSRARNLHRAARKIAAVGGRFPDTYDGVRGLPGVGPYTAGAILSIAFQKPHAVLDGNVARVLSRLYGIKENIKEGRTQRRLWELAGRLVPRERPGDWNQALMELGATVCLPESPDCGACPVSRRCVAFREGLQDRLPVTGKRRPFVDLKWTCLWIEDGGKVLLWKRSAKERFLKSLWGLPEPSRLKARSGGIIKTVRHTITHHRIALELRTGRLAGPRPPEATWVPRSRLRDYLVSSLWLKCLGSS